MEQEMKIMNWKQDLLCTTDWNGSQDESLLV
jgi:hypothetical protein